MRNTIKAAIVAFGAMGALAGLGGGMASAQPYDPGYAGDPGYAAGQGYYGDPAYGDPAAVFMPLADALGQGAQSPLAQRVRGAARLSGDARRAAFRRLDERLGAGGLGAIPLVRANFSTPVSSMLVGRGTHPVFDVDLAQLSTR